MTPTWYDLLGVEPTASADEIRAAWKTAITDLDPTDRRFRTLNEAAEVLLDPERRSEYDAGLVDEDEAETDVAPPPIRPKVIGGAKRGRSLSDVSGETTTQGGARLPTHEEQDSRTKNRRRGSVDLDADLEPVAIEPLRRAVVPAWLLAALAVLVAVLLGCAGYLLQQPSDDSVAAATSDAQGAAEHAASTILAYDYRHLDEDQKAAEALMTPDYRKKKYDPLFSQIAANAPDLKAIVTTHVVASGVVRSGADRVQILVFVDRPTERADLTAPLVYRDQVVLTMEKSGDDWLVDDMDTNHLAS